MTEHDRQRDTLDPAVDPARWEDAVGRIMTAAQPELARREVARGAVDVLEDWARPIFAIAASLVLLASAALLQSGSGLPTDIATADGDPNTVAEVFLSAELAAWIEGGYSLTADELVTAIDDM